ncbi:2-iminobutanoate/2-iminopropanoate deaminase [Roseibium hamelinense]|uniref:2-iminobutanoate/2-iminopropanoate deaminase n=1 Tax=Roseibium hamelinense TaxID=150831 RepID=A0A562TGM7_9HYPH|nr:Rid family hydrolase [Roseibium hamelinense]MTI46057.1 RidA family protein [Roseibium hamelinense]TWI92751.1 2-iminobutanoate/2-iminopropanoate deaminase [Roseibium hamelinense]
MRIQRIRTVFLLLASTLLVCGYVADTQARDITTYPSTAVDGLPYSGVVKAQGMVYVGGVLGTAPGTAELVSGGVEDETRQALNHVKDMMELAGTSLDQTVKCIVLLSNIDYFPKMNDVFREFFPTNPPTRSTIIVPEIPMGAAMEIDCTAVAKD